MTVAKKQGRIKLLSTPSFRFLDFINYLGPGTSLWEVGENVRKPPDKIMAAVWVVWLCRQTGLWGFAAVSLLVLKTEERVRRMPVSVPGQGNENVRWLVRVLQQSWCRTIPGSAGKNEKVLLRAWCQHFKDALSIPGVSLQYLLRGMLQRFYAPELYAPGKKVYEMFKGAGSSGRAKSSFTRKHEARKTAMRSHRYVNARTCQRGARLRRQYVVPKHHPAGNAVRTRKSGALREYSRRGWYVGKPAKKENVVRFCGSGF